MNAGTRTPLFHSHVESPLVYDSRPFPPLPLISLFLILLWTQAGLSLRMCHHPQVVSGGGGTLLAKTSAFHSMCGQAGTTQTPSEERKSPCSCLTKTQKSLGCYQGQRGELEKVSGIQEGKDYRIRGAELPGRGCPVGLAGGVTPGPQEVQWRRKMDGRGAGGCWFWFHPDDMVERDRSGPNFLLFANFSKYVLKMTPKPFLCYPPILPVPAHSR